MAIHSKGRLNGHATRAAKKAAVASPDKVLVDKLRKAEREKEMVKRSTVGLYSLKTNDSSFGLPFCSVGDHFALLAAKRMLPLANVYKVGLFCLYDGTLTKFAKPVIILDNKVVENEN